MDGYKFGNDVIIGYTYNTEVSYKVMPDIINKEDKIKQHGLVMISQK